jgi:hypothetical protein
MLVNVMGAARPALPAFAFEACRDLLAIRLGARHAALDVSAGPDTVKRQLQARDAADAVAADRRRRGNNRATHSS